MKKAGIVSVKKAKKAAKNSDIISSYVYKYIGILLFYATKVNRKKHLRQKVLFSEELGVRN
jgi:hypothetical protein